MNLGLQQIMKSIKLSQILIILSVFSASSSAVFRPPDDSAKVSEESDAPWHPDWAEVVKCKRGDLHSRFPACWCGQYAKTVDDDEVPVEELENEGYHKILRKNRIRPIFYVCLPCSSCPDGILMTGKCRQGQDTSCNLNRCTDPDHVFDRGKKACVPNPKEPVEHTEGLSIINLDAPTARPTEDVLQPLVAVELPGEVPSQAKTWHLHAGVIAIVVSLVAFAIVNTILIIAVVHRKRGRYRTLTRAPSNLSRASTQSGCTCMYHCETPV